VVQLAASAMRRTVAASTPSSAITRQVASTSSARRQSWSITLGTAAA
jgi:hypothetical protein